jgi:LysR family glycine cleavage system transcriptional activator
MDHPLHKLPPLDAVRGFVAVCRRMSITLAARDLCLTQSAVSRQIQALEEFFRTPLLVRKHRAITLTDAGERLYELAAPWLERMSEFTEAVRDERRLRPVTITASIGVAALWLLPRLGAFQAQHPQVDVRVAANNRMLDLQQEAIDLAIRYCSPADVPPHAVRLFGEQVVPVAAPALARRAFSDPQALLDHALLDYDDRAHPWLQWPAWLQARGMSASRPKATLHFNQYDQVIHAALEGQGIALGRIPLVQPMLDDGRLVAQSGAAMTVDDYAYWLVNASSEPRPEVVLFRDWLVAQVKADSA